LRIHRAGTHFFLVSRILIPAAKRLQCRQIILLSGKRVEGAPPGSQHAASIEALKRAADVLSSAGLVAVIEPIDRIENPTIYLDGVTEAFEIAAAVNSPSVRVLYDVYHEQREFGNLIEKFEKNIEQVGLGSYCGCFPDGTNRERVRSTTSIFIASWRS